MVIPYMTELVEIVSSRVKAEIFRLLFGLRQPELHMREIVRQSGLALGTVQQELKGLSKVGLVKSRRDGNRVYFSANTNHPAYPELSALVIKTTGLAGILGNALQDKAIILAFVFGSLARGEARAESDVDLMIIGSVGLRRLTALLSGVAEKVGREINPHILTPDGFRERKKNADHFVSSVLSSPRIFVKGNEHELAAVGE
jgi:predicted nucleotidyltransferase